MVIWIGPWREWFEKKVMDVELRVRDPARVRFLELALARLRLIFLDAAFSR
jgi:hypothetical protein